MPLAAKLDARFTYADYLTWPDEERWELIGGGAYDMTPAPTSRHQRVSGEIFFRLRTALKGTPCVPFYAPTDVVLSEADVVQPDVLVVCDPAKITPACIRGAPDLVIEILSSSTALKDRRAKKELYQRAGVREYLLVEPEARYVERFVLDESGAYGRGELLGPPEVVRLKSLEGVDLALAEIFEEEVPATAAPRP